MLLLLTATRRTSAIIDIAADALVVGSENAEADSDSRLYK